MTFGNVMLAVDMIGGLMQRVMAYQAAVKAAIAEGRDLTDAELDAMSEAAGMSLDLARKRLEALRQ